MGKRPVMYVSVFFIVFILAAATVSYGQWIETNGPFGGEVRYVGFMGSTLLAGPVDQGFFRSTDDGATWTRSDSGLTDMNLRCSAVLNGRLFIGTLGGIFVSADSGKIWSSPPAAGLTCDTVETIEVIDSTLYIGTYGGGVFSSTDYGNSWTPLNSGLSSLLIRSFMVSNGVFYAGTAGGGLFMSADSGKSWNQLNGGVLNSVGSPESNVYALCAIGGTIVAGSDGGTFFSSDGGVSWSSGISNDPMPVVLGLAKVGDSLFAASFKGLFVSADSGKTWDFMDTPMSGTEVLAVVSNGSEFLAGTWYAGAFLSNDRGTEWKSISSGFNASFINATLVYGNKLFAATEGLGLFCSTDGGSWIKSDSGIPVPNIYSLVADSTLLFAGGDESIYVSSDSGRSWVNSSKGLINYPATIYDFCVFNRKIFAGTLSSGLYVSTDNGASWTSQIGTAPRGTILTLAADDSVLFAGYNLGIMRSTDGGNNWEQADSGLPIAQGSPVQVYAFAFDGKYGIYAATDSGLCVSQDQGQDWARLHIGAKDAIVTAVTVIQGNIFTATEDSIFRSADHGQTWTSVSMGLPAGQVWSFADYESDLYAATFGGGIWSIWDRPLPGLIIEGIGHGGSMLPQSYTMLQNYPNPFNPSTVIDYQLPANSRVILKVYDVLGREVTTLVDGRENAGNHSVAFDAGGLASGVYFYVLRAGEVIISRKMILLK